jgi:hypothetical protein
LRAVGADLAARLNPGPKPVRLERHRAKQLRQVSELHRPRRNLASHQKADKARLQARGGLADLRACQSKAVVEHPRSSAAEHRLQPAQVLVSVAAAQSEDSLATASLARRRLRVLVQVKREAEKNADNPESINLRPHRLPVQVQAKREVEEREGRVRMVNLAASQELERLLQLTAGKGSRSAERKRARGHHRHADHNNFLLISLAASEQKSGAAFLRVSCRAFAAANTILCSTHLRQNLFDMATVSSVRPSQLELDSLECSSTCRELTLTFVEDDQSRPAAIAIFRSRRMTH